MSFRIVYIDNSDVVAHVESRDEAVRRLRGFLEEHPQLDDEIGIQEVDLQGHPVGETAVGLPVAGQQLALNG